MAAGNWQQRTFAENLHCNAAGEVPWMVTRAGHYDAFCCLCHKFASEGHVHSDLHHGRLTHFLRHPWDLAPAVPQLQMMPGQPSGRDSWWLECKPGGQVQAPAVPQVATVPVSVEPLATSPPGLHQDQLLQRLHAAEQEVRQLQEVVNALVTRVQSLETRSRSGSGFEVLNESDGAVLLNESDGPAES